MYSKKVVVIIVTYNASEYIGACLSSLEKVNYPKEEMEIVIVENASSDATRGFIEKNLTAYNLQLTAFFQSVNLGFAEGNNVGMQYAMKKGYDYVYLLNQDTEVDPDFLVEAVQVMENDKNIGAAQSRLMLFDKKDTINSIGNELHYLGFGYAGGHGKKLTTYNLQLTADIAYPSGAGVILRVSALREVGLFDPRFFMYHEDTDLGWRMRLCGYRVVLAKDSVVYHKYQFSRSIQKYYYMERNRMMLILQNYHLTTLLLIFPALLFFNTTTFFYSFFGGFWREEIRSCLYFLQWKNWKEIFRARSNIQSMRKISDRDIVKKFTSIIEFQDLKNPLLERVFNPLSDLYWRMIKFFIRW